MADRGLGNPLGNPLGLPRSSTLPSKSGDVGRVIYADLPPSSDWVPAGGQELAIADYPALFDKIGKTVTGLTQAKLGAPLPSGDNYLYGVDTDRKGVWVITYLASVIRSFDGGATWSTKNISLSLTGIRSDRAGTWIGTSASAIYKSIDNGESWVLIHSGTGIAVIPPATDYAGTWLVAKSNGFYRSTDNGNTWEAVEPWTLAAVSSLVSVGNGNWVAAKGDNYLHTSSDNGKTWIARPVTSQFPCVGTNGAGLTVYTQVINTQREDVRYSYDSGQTSFIAASLPANEYRAFGFIFTGTNAVITYGKAYSSFQYAAKTSLDNGTTYGLGVYTGVGDFKDGAYDGKDTVILVGPLGVYKLTLGYAANANNYFKLPMLGIQQGKLPFMKVR